MEKLTPLREGRFLTLNTVVRMNQIEVTRNRNDGGDESNIHTPAAVESFRQAVAEGWPGGRMTWSLSWQALHSEAPNYVDIRRLIRRYAESLGDDVTFIPGGYFANAYNTREQVSRDLHDALQTVQRFMGDGFRPRSIVAGFLAAENLRYLAQNEGIHVCQGNIWSQFAIDNQDGDGSPCYPYYPSQEHFCKPAQSRDDFIDCVNLDGWTVDFLAARREGFKDGFNSRMGVGPIETLGKFPLETALEQMMATTATHFDQGFSLNGFAWVANNWEICLVPSLGHLPYLTRWLSEVRRRWPRAQLITQGEFGEVWRRAHPDNDGMDYRFVQEGTGIGGSDKGKRIRWFMNQRFRLALLRDLTNESSDVVIDFTRYDQPAREPQGLTRSWSLLGEINQKQTRPQDQPRPLTQLSEDAQRLIFSHYPELEPLQAL